MKTKKYTKRYGEVNGQHYVERYEASREDKRTKVEDVLMTIKKIKWTWAGHVISRTDNR